MKIKFKSISRRALGKYRPGEVADLPDAEALNFLNLGYATPVKGETVSENTSLPLKETEISGVRVPVITTPPVIYGKKKKKKK